MATVTSETGNCYSYALSVLAGVPEENGVRVRKFTEQMSDLGYVESTKEEAEVVLKVDENGIPYHVAIVVELRADGNHLLKHRFGFGFPVELVLLNELTPRDPNHFFKFYKKPTFAHF